MAKDKKLVAAITDMEQDFPQWYTEKHINKLNKKSCILKIYSSFIYSISNSSAK